MEMEKLNNFIGKDTLSIVDAMERIDKNAKGILFIVDENNHIVGSLTDGDIRRWILKSGNINSIVIDAMNKSPHMLSVEQESNASKVMKEHQIVAIPIVDSNKKIVDISLLLDYEEKKHKGNLSHVSVAIMAGGQGTRLYPYTKILPKPLIPIGETPVMERILNYYNGFGIKQFYITVNYKKTMIRSYFDDIDAQYEIKFIEEVKPLGTGGSIKLIKEKFDKPLFVANCDTLILADYYDIYQNHIQTKNDITIVSALKKFQVPYGVLHTGDNGVLEYMEEKPKISHFINTGMYVINPDIIELIPNDTVFHMTHLVDKVMEKGGKVGTYPISEDSFLDMGELNEMKRMEEKLNVVSK